VTNRKCSGSAVLRSVVGLLLCFGILVSSTFALVAEANDSNVMVTSADFEVKMEWLPGKIDPGTAAQWNNAENGSIFNYQKWEPGYTEVRHIKITNAGQHEFKYYLTLIEGWQTGILADVIDVYYLDPAQAVTGRDHAIFTENNRIGTLAEVLQNIETTASGTLDQGECHTVTIALKMRESAGNQYQGKIGADFSVKLVAVSTEDLTNPVSES